MVTTPAGRAPEKSLDPHLEIDKGPGDEFALEHRTTPIDIDKEALQEPERPNGEVSSIPAKAVTHGPKSPDMAPVQSTAPGDKPAPAVVVPIDESLTVQQKLSKFLGTHLVEEIKPDNMADFAAGTMDYLMEHTQPEKKE